MTQVVSSEISIAINEALAPAVLLLRVPHLEQLLKAVKSGVSLAARQAHNDLALPLPHRVGGLCFLMVRSFEVSTGRLHPFKRL